jgi:glycosyltransferase involved in cell wall biosynthesis
MKILMAAIPNHHFFQWVDQLKESGYEVYWFDVSDGGIKVERINWVHQIKGWKLKFDFPLRHFFKNKFPRIYKGIQKYNERKIAAVFTKLLEEIQPDMVHCFEMKLAGLPILSVMKQNKIPFVYSSWGSDMYAYQNLGISRNQAKLFLNRVDYLITDCNRDFQIAQHLGFTNQFLGIFPGNGGIDIETVSVRPINNRTTICIKGYNDGVGKALVVIKAIESIQFDSSIDFLIFSADENVAVYLNKSDYFKQRKVEIISRNSFIANKLLLQKLGSCLLYIGNSISDGMPNSLLEAMGMGAFPIQSNPGKVSEEVMTHGVNGFLIENPLDSFEIANWIRKAFTNDELRANAQKYNVDFVKKNYNREYLKTEIVQLYKSIL